MTSHRALHIPELLREVIRYTSDTDHRAHGLVCKDWAKVVLDYAWRDVSAAKLFRLLAPISLDKTSRQHSFSRLIGFEGWSQFQKYHYRVRALSCTGTLLSPSVYATTGLSLPFCRPLLPNLTSLICTPDRVLIQVLASPFVTHFHLRVEGQPIFEQEYEIMLQYLPICFPNLERLSLLDSPTKQSIRDLLIEVFPALPRLVDISISAELLTPDVFMILSQLPLLRSLDGDYGIFATSNEPIPSHEPSLEMFPALEYLQLETRLGLVNSLLKLWTSPALSLQVLTLVECETVLPKNCAVLVEWIASKAPLLEELSIGYEAEDEEDIEDRDIDRIQPLPFSIFEPLSSCKYLTSLTITYPIPLELDEAQLVAFATALPDLRHLKIGKTQRPAPVLSPFLGLSILSSLAPVCNSLESLSVCLYFDTVTTFLGDAPTPIVPFKSLTNFDVGRSIIHNRVPVALFLSRILPDSCALSFSPGSGADDEDRVRGWEQVVMCGAQCFTQPVSSDGWYRFQKYHHRIRILHCPGALLSLHPSVYAIAGLNRPYPGPFLPNLTLLDCFADPSLIQLFASPTITTFLLKGEGQMKTQQGYEFSLKYLPTCITNLQSLSLANTPNKKAIRDALIEILPNLRHLNRIELHTVLLSPEVIGVISKLPLLRSLRGHGLNPNPSEMLSYELSPESFPALEYLRLHACFERTASFLKPWTSPVSLRSLFLAEGNTISPESYLVLIKWAARNAPLLETLTIKFNLYEGEIDIDPLPFSVFEPLFSCKHLSSLTVSYPTPFEMTEDELVTLVTALPLLRHLDIGSISAPPIKTEPSLGLSALSSIAPLCNSLESLCIYLSFRTTSNVEDVPTPSVPFKCLAMLDLGRSPIRWPAPVALFLSRILPASCDLSFSETTGSDDEGREEEWERVVPILDALRITNRDAKKSG
ncbi:hypothetical protein ONZ45_g5649 [Pleurotus djamor]|nr:hypothetical protein ONZ45_g5649 [Pleurotus djamor]